MEQKDSLYSKQLEFQKKLNKIKFNRTLEKCEDNQEQFKYHIMAMLEEMGEVLAADKRWKMYRNSKYDIENKKEELADVLITVLNLFIYSGIDEQEMENIVSKKIEENIRRIENATK